MKRLAYHHTLAAFLSSWRVLVLILHHRSWKHEDPYQTQPAFPISTSSVPTALSLDPYMARSTAPTVLSLDPYMPRSTRLA